jgi:hypothetical protein
MIPVLMVENQSGYFATHQYRVSIWSSLNEMIMKLEQHREPCTQYGSFSKKWEDAPLTRYPAIVSLRIGDHFEPAVVFVARKMVKTARFAMAPVVANGKTPVGPDRKNVVTVESLGHGGLQVLGPAPGSIPFGYDV